MKRTISIFLSLALLFCSIGPIAATANQVGPPFPTDLQNSSFGTHPDSAQTAAASYLVAQADMPGWMTSDSKGQFEIWRTGFQPAGNTTVFNALSGTGNWFVEINANDGPPSYIYQDLTTTPGALYQWSFYHRGRNPGQDTAMMLLGPAGPLTTANAQAAFGGTQAPTGITTAGPQYLAATPAAWTQHLGYYQPTTTTVRYELYSYASVPGSTGASTVNRAAEGNLVDQADWVMIAAPTTSAHLYRNPIDPNIVGQVNTPGGFTGQFAAPYDQPAAFTPGSHTIVVNVCDSNGNLVGSITSVVNVYAYLQIQYVDQAGAQIAPSAIDYYPSTFAANNAADFSAAGAFNYNVSGVSPPATITSGGVTYELRSLSTVSDPSGASAPLIGTLTQNETITWVYVPVPQALKVVLVDSDGNLLPDPLPASATLDNGSPYRVTAIGASGDLDYPLSVTDGSDTYNFLEVASVPIGTQTVTDPTVGIMDSDKTVVVVYSLSAPTTYTASGTVTGLLDNSGLTINYTIDGSPGIAITDAGGSYSISDVPAGSELIIGPLTNVPGPGGVGTYGATPVAGYDIPNVHGDSTGNNFNYVITYTASGTVTGLPTVSGVSISYTLSCPDDSIIENTVLTDASGNYSIPNIPAGSSLVITAVADIIEGGGDYMVHPQVGYSLDNIQSDMPNNNFNYGLRYIVSGNVRGLPDLAGIIIDYTITDSNGVETTASTTTDVSGNYSIPRVKAGSTVTIDPLPNVAGEGTTYIIAPHYGYDLPNIQSNMPDNDFVYIPSYVASGTVSGLPNNAGITISYTITGPVSGVLVPGTVTTDASGNYSIPEIPARGRITIQAPTSVGFYSESPVIGYDLNNVVQNMPDNDFVYRIQTFAVSGNVSGLPNNAGIVISYTIDGIARTVITDADGNYYIPNVPAGSEVVISAPNNSGSFAAGPATGYTLTNITEDMSNNDFVFTSTDSGGGGGNNTGNGNNGNNGGGSNSNTGGGNNGGGSDGGNNNGGSGSGSNTGGGNNNSSGGGNNNTGSGNNGGSTTAPPKKSTPKRQSASTLPKTDDLTNVNMLVAALLLSSIAATIAASTSVHLHSKKRANSTGT